MILYRLTLAKYANTAFSGVGALRVGGRWTPPGFPAVYTASSIALSVLETLVHVDPTVMPKHLVIRVDVPDTIRITEAQTQDLPNDWRTTPAPAVLQAIGREWIYANDSALLQVPSVVVPQESNFVLNPLHVDFAQCVIGAPDPFAIDARLIG